MAPIPDASILAATTAAAFVIGALIGSVGVGGLLLAPWLVRVVGLGIRDAIVVAMAAFIATGLVAVWLFRSNELGIGARWPAVAATVPGALLGAIALSAIPPSVAATILAAFLVATGLRILLAKPAEAESNRETDALADGGTGLATGFFSALTGTGGPMVMIPLLVWRGTPLLVAIALGQVVQLPVASVATLANIAAGGVDLTLATFIAVPMGAGVVCGRWLAQALPLSALSTAVAILLVGTGIWFGATQS